MRRVLAFLVVFVLFVGVGAAHGQVNLSVQGDHFAVNGKGKFLLFASYFDAMHASSPATDFAYLKALGFDGIRMFPAWSRIHTSAVPCGPVVSPPTFYLAGTPGDPESYLIPTTHANWITFIGILTAAREQGLIVDLTLDAASPEAQMAVPVIAERLKGQFRNVLFDVYNEWDIRGANETTVGALVQAVHDHDPGRITTASGADRGTFAKAYHLDTVAFHDPRTAGYWWTELAMQTELNTIRANLSPERKPIYYQEPMPFENVLGCPVEGVPTSNQQHDSNPTDHRNAAKFAKKHGAAAWTFHSRQSFSLAGITLEQALTQVNSNEKAELEAISGSVAQICDAPGPTCGDAYWHVSSPLRFPRADFDNDLKTDLPLYRPSSAHWLISKSSTGYNPAANLTVQWGAPGGSDIPVNGDFDGDGKADAVNYRSSGEWLILKSGSGFLAGDVYVWGAGVDVPVPGDFDGDGRMDIVVYRPSSAHWFILKSSTNFTVSATYQWGSTGDIPIPADFDGDGATDIAYYRPSNGTWDVLKSSSNFTASMTFVLGAGVDVPVPGDYDGDGRTDIAVYRPSTAHWFIALSTLNYPVGSPVTHQWGSTGDVPVAGDFEGDGKTDIAIYRSSNGTWYILLSSTGFVGGAGYAWGGVEDVPVTELP